MNFSKWIFLWLMPMVGVSLGSVPPATTHPLLEVLRRYPRLAWPDEDTGSNPKQTVCKEADPKKCCPMCLQGSYLASGSRGEAGEGCTCEQCPKGLYTEKPNLLTKCKQCRRCEARFSVKQVQACGPDQDAQCGCEEGHYEFDSSKDNFVCYECSVCANRDVIAACSQKSDTQCGSCSFGFYEDHGKTCQPCTQNVRDKPGCQHHSMTPQAPPSTKSTSQGPSAMVSSPLLVLAIVLFGTVLLGSILCGFLHVWASRERTILGQNQTSEPQQACHFNLVRDSVHQDQYCENHNDPCTAVSKTSLQIAQMCQCQDTRSEIPMKTGIYGSTMPLLKDTDPKMLRADPRTADSWPPPVIYAIIGEVPARRWKEFLRLLSVPDGQIERVEVEVGPCYLEQQYQMLRMWSQRECVTLGAVYSALHRMNLSGCAQELQDKLRQLQQEAA